MLAALVFQVPLALFPATTPPTCQLEVLSPSALEERALQNFDRRVHWYVRLHRRLERSLPPEHLFADLENMPMAVEALHQAMVDARPNARAGGFFTPDLAEVLIARLELAAVAGRVLGQRGLGRGPGGVRREACGEVRGGAGGCERGAFGGGAAVRVGHGSRARLSVTDPSAG